MRPRLLALWLLLSAVPLSSQPRTPLADGQSFAGYFTFGDEVKIRADGAIGRFTVVEVRERALVLQGRYDDTTRLISVDAMRILEISRGPYTRSQGAGRGLVRGAVVGLVLGGLAAATPGCGSCGAEGAIDLYTVQGALAGAALGGFVGTVIGMTFPGTRWESIPVRSFHVRPSAAGRGVELGVGFRF